MSHPNNAHNTGFANSPRPVHPDGEHRKPLAAVVAAGGQSLRFGTDKAAFVLDGEMMADRAARLASSVATEIWLGLSDEAGLRQEGWRELGGRHNILFDNPAGIGPMGSLHAALLRSPHEWVLFLACDLPGLRPEHLRKLAAARTPECLAVVSVDSTGRRHPTVALYHRDILPRVGEALAAGKHALWRLLQGGETREAVLPDEALLNMNRPSEAPPSQIEKG